MNRPASPHRVSALTPLPDSNWDWSDIDRDEWKVVDKNSRFQEFYDYWRASPHDFGSSQSFPYNLSLGTKPPLHPYRTSDSQIVVTKSYDEMYYRLLDLHENGDPGSGAVITGQPGIGTSLWLNPRLLQQLIGASVAQENPISSISCLRGLFRITRP